MPTLLCIDDDPAVLLLREAVLQRAGFHVTVCKEPSTGLAKLMGSHIDAVVTDYEMPGMDGFAFADHARANGCKQPIIMCTGAVSLPSGRDRHISEVLSKTETPLHLIRALRSCLNISPSAMA